MFNEITYNRFDILAADPAHGVNIIQSNYPFTEKHSFWFLHGQFALPLNEYDVCIWHVKPKKTIQ